MAALLGATFFTLPFALGAGGILFYGVRRHHRICPRCGHGWGRMGENAVGRRPADPLAADRRLAGAPPGGGIERSWSIMLFVMGAILLGVGAVQIEAVLLTLGLLSTAGALVLRRQANRAREHRRAALIASLQAPVLKLAAQRSGKLTVTDVAASLGWSLRRAEKVLHSLDDGWRVSSDVTDEGVIVYEFREILLGPSTSG